MKLNVMLKIPGLIFARFNKKTKQGMELDKLYKVHIPHGILAEEALERVYAYLFFRLPTARDLFRENMDNEDWKKWLISSGKITGTWPKRFAKAYYKKYNKNLSPTHISAIGEILGKDMSSSGRDYFFEITKNLDWRAGGFQESPGSCWWGTGGDKAVFKRRGGEAVLFYENEDEYSKNKGKKGIGRAWFWEEDGYDVIFNAYGLNLSTIAHCLSMLNGASYKFVGINSDLYINNGGYAIGQQSEINELKYVPVCYDDDYEEEEYE